jgi:hypothetical protein
MPFVYASVLSLAISILVQVPGKSITTLLQNGTFDTLHTAVVLILQKNCVFGLYRE